jgi:hypothetical protein
MHGHTAGLYDVFTGTDFSPVWGRGFSANIIPLWFSYLYITWGIKSQSQFRDSLNPIDINKWLEVVSFWASGEALCAKISYRITVTVN